MGACVGQWGCTAAGMGHRWEPQHNDQDVEARTGYEGEIKKYDLSIQACF